MRIRRRIVSPTVSAAALLLVAALLLTPRAAHAQHVSLWAGGGLGSFISGGAGDPNGHRIVSVAVSLPGERLGLRLLKGTLERSHGIPANTADNDLDYRGLDVLMTPQLTGFPVSLALGAARYEEAYHLGYPNLDLGGRTFVHRWGPHAGALRSLRLARFGELWAEADLHYAPYRPRQVLLFLDVGIGLYL